MLDMDVKVIQPINQTKDTRSSPDRVAPLSTPLGGQPKQEGHHYKSHCSLVTERVYEWRGGGEWLYFPITLIAGEAFNHFKTKSMRLESCCNILAARVTL